MLSILYILTQNSPAKVWTEETKFYPPYLPLEAPTSFPSPPIQIERILDWILWERDKGFKTVEILENEEGEEEEEERERDGEAKESH